MSRAFQSVTFAATLNDIGSWALISWHATFYARVYDLPADVYGPLLAVVVPVGGLLGGVGGGLMGDWLSRIGERRWLTTGARARVCSCQTAPTLQALARVPHRWWRCPSWRRIIACHLQRCWLGLRCQRHGAPRLPSWSATCRRRGSGRQRRRCTCAFATSLVVWAHYVRGGRAVRHGARATTGVAVLADRFDLQTAMLLIPLCFLLSGAGFFVAEQVRRAASLHCFCHRVATDDEGHGGAAAAWRGSACMRSILFVSPQP